MEVTQSQNSVATDAETWGPQSLTEEDDKHNNNDAETCDINAETEHAVVSESSTPKHSGIKCKGGGRGVTRYTKTNCVTSKSPDLMI